MSREHRPRSSPSNSVHAGLFNILLQERKTGQNLTISGTWQTVPYWCLQKYDYDGCGKQENTENTTGKRRMFQSKTYHPKGFPPLMSSHLSPVKWHTSGHESRGRRRYRCTRQRLITPPTLLPPLAYSPHHPKPHPRLLPATTPPLPFPHPYRPQPKLTTPTPSPIPPLVAETLREKISADLLSSAWGVLCSWRDSLSEGDLLDVFNSTEGEWYLGKVLLIGPDEATPAPAATSALQPMEVEEVVQEGGKGEEGQGEEEVKGRGKENQGGREGGGGEKRGERGESKSDGEGGGGKKVEGGGKEEAAAAGGEGGGDRAQVRIHYQGWPNK